MPRDKTSRLDELDAVAKLNRMISRLTVMGNGFGWLLLALAASGCGSVSEGAAPTPTPAVNELKLAKSGARLSALGYRAGEATQLRTLYDEQLGFECDLSLASDGRGLRCT